MSKAQLYLYILIPLPLSLIDCMVGKDLLSDFASIIIPALATLLTIYLATSALVIGEINKVSHKITNEERSKIIAEMQNSLKKQIVFLIILLVGYVLKGLPVDIVIIQLNNTPFNILAVLYNAFMISSFLYYLAAIHDIGNSLYKMMEFND